MTTASLPTKAELAGWTPDERAHLSALLDELIERPGPPARGRPSLRRVLVLLTTLGGSLVLFPWIGYLSVALPATSQAGAWRTAWVGYDIALAAVLAITGLAAWQRRQVLQVLMPLSATLMLVDAWFDVTLSWGTEEQGGALLTALLIEIPLALLLLHAETVLLRRASKVTAALRGRRPSQEMWDDRPVTAPAHELPEDDAADEPEPGGVSVTS